MNTIQKIFGQFDTPINLSYFLCNRLGRQYEEFIDLGAGTGNLSHCLDSQGVMIEIDSARIAGIPHRDQVRIVQENILDSTFKVSDHIGNKKPRLFLSNPPFNKINSGYKCGFFKSSTASQKLRQTDYLFLDLIMQNMNQQDGLVLIISSPFMESKAHAADRELFFSRFNDVQIYSLHKYTFADAEVQAYAVLCQNISKDMQPIQLYRMNAKYRPIELIQLERSRAKQSLNFKTQLQIERQSDMEGGLILADFNPVIFRGRSHSEDRVHTSDLKNKELHLEDRNLDGRKNIVRKGDILIARVGNVIGRCSLVMRGKGEISDVVLCIRVDPKDVDRVWQSINSQHTVEYLKLNAKGKCAKYIDHDDVLSIKII